MSPKGRPEGESAPKRVSAEGSPVSPKGRPEGESAPKRVSAEGSPVTLAARLSRSGLDWIVPDWDVAAPVLGFVTTRTRGALGDAGSATATGVDLGPSHLARADAAARAAILASRRLVGTFLPSPPVWLEQVHGRDVAVIDERTLDASRAAPPVADAAVTRLPGVPLSIRVADCLPVLFADEQGAVVGAAHAGWRGLAAGVLEATVVAMDAPADAIVAWIGPGIGPRAFEVSDDVRDAFVRRDRNAAAHFVPRSPGKWLADLPALARRQLAAIGVARVGGGGLCTYTDAARFHSFRRDRTAARLGAFVWRQAP
jgi:YfiH family protein